MTPTLRGLILLSFAVVPGCSGNVQTIAMAPDALKEGTSLQGVVFYQPAYIKLTYAFTARLDKDGKVVGSADEKTCVPLLQKEDVAVMPDLGHPMLIRNASGALSAAKFAVTLNNGMLASVNAEPTQKLSDVLTAAAGILKELPALLPLAGGDACNASPRLVRFERVTLH
jgi:hypothetical protein